MKNKMNILMIDDDPAVVAVVRDILEELEYGFHSADNGASGLKKIEESQPDLIILDVNLPDTSGFGVCQSIRRNPATRKIPIIMLTGQYVGSSDKISGLNLGADDYIVKPFDNDHLIARVEALLRYSYY